MNKHEKMEKLIVLSHDRDQEVADKAFADITEAWTEPINALINKKFKRHTEKHLDEMFSVAISALSDSVKNCREPEIFESLAKENITQKLTAFCTKLDKSEKEARIRELMTLYHSDDPEISNNALNDLVNENGGLINHFIDKSYSSYKAKWHDDLFQSGVCGLMESLKSFDPDRGTLSTHAAHYIEHELHEFITSFVNGLKPHYSKNIKKVRKAVDELKNEGNDNPTYTDIAMESGLSVTEVMRALEVFERSQTVSADDEANEGMLKSYAPDPQEQYEDSERISTLYSAIKFLNDDERTAICMKYHLGPWEGQSSITSDDIAKALNVPIPNVKSILAKAIRKLRSNTSLASVSGSKPRNLDEAQVSIVPVAGAMREESFLAEDGEILSTKVSFAQAFSGDNISFDDDDDDYAIPAKKSFSNNMNYDDDDEIQF